jgi:hypothetical protein
MNGILTALFFALVPLLLIGYTVYRLVKRGLEMRHLAERGVEATARIVDRQQFNTATGTRRNDRYLVYEFTDDRGVTHRHRSNVVSRDWLAVQTGDSIPIVHLPENPAVNAPRDVVENARKALKK